MSPSKRKFMSSATRLRVDRAAPSFIAKMAELALRVETRRYAEAYEASDRRSPSAASRSMTVAWKRLRNAAVAYALASGSLAAHSLVLGFAIGWRAESLFAKGAS